MERGATPDSSDIEATIAAVRAANVQAAKAANAGRAALSRLVPVALGYSGQSGVVLRWLASVYNGSDAPGVELDEIRRLDWSLREDVLAVVLGCAEGGFCDVEINEEFARAGGANAVDRLHAAIGNGAQTAGVLP